MTLCSSLGVSVKLLVLCFSVADVKKKSNCGDKRQERSAALICFCLKPFVSYGILWISMEFWTNLEIPFYWNHDVMPSTLFLVIPFSFIVALDQHITYNYTHIYLISGQFLWKAHQRIEQTTVELPSNSPQLPHVSRCGEVRTLLEKAKTWSPQSIENRNRPIFQTTTLFDS